MATNEKAEVRKLHVAALLQSLVGELEKPRRDRRDWYCSTDNRNHFFLTDSGKSPPWYDMTQADVNGLAAKERGFIIFILGEKDNFLVIPAKEFKLHFEHHSTGPNEDGYYPLHLEKNHFRELKDWNLGSFHKNLSQISN